ncbi:aminotransferase class V-fold PLP-dependent enzyme [Flavobacterium sp. ST-87]|uniref:Aminotransferase class V-fold PLP-dependent enzyme n=1 Tax=Flavobacterium plantiphilum TaxID=3163297 RepID=A0ABW8XQV4_9FLAO
MYNTNTTTHPKENSNPAQTDLETYFSHFRSDIVGIDQEFESPYGIQKIIYADWTASGRLYKPIEDKLVQQVGAFVANPHTETAVTGAVMTLAYQEARRIIKKHVNAAEDDVLIMDGSGMTGVINKFQRILGIKVNENLRAYTHVPDALRPLVFISHMEHHSNQTSWLETIAHVEIIPCDKEGLLCFDHFESLLKQYQNRPLKIASVTACSNVTGIRTDYHRIAEMMHLCGGLCFVDFACSAPYVAIDMHPENSQAYLDAIFFSPHKFLGGPGTSGVLLFNKKLYQNSIPDHPGGGTVTYTNPWGNHNYIKDIETREDGGTPGFLQTIKTALAIQLKEQMGVPTILAREQELNAIVFDRLSTIKNLHILAQQHTERLGVFSFYIENLHYNLVVRLLNDRFGIQTRGGCSCAGTYGHYLLHLDVSTSQSIEAKILEGCLVDRPGWVRMSIHPTMTTAEVVFICDAIAAVAQNAIHWQRDYRYDSHKNAFLPQGGLTTEKDIIKDWFHL